MDEGKYFESFVIPTYLADRSRHLSPASTLAMTQEMSYRAADHLGIGDRAMSVMGLAWVLCRARFMVRRAPEMCESVTLETWHRGLSGPFFIRNYRILDMTGNELVIASSACVLIDKKTRALSRIDHIPGFGYSEPQCNEDVFDEPVRKIRVPECGFFRNEVVHPIGYTDIDFVGHTNNTNYLKWAMDCEAMNGGNGHPCDVTVNFLRETYVGERITFRKVRSCGPSVLVGTVGDRTAMTAELTY